MEEIEAKLAVLEVSDLISGYGKVVAINSVSMSLTSGSVHALLGANGAGKTTLLRSIIGSAKIFSGSIAFSGAQIHTERMDRRVQRGIGIVAEGRRLFPRLSVKDNLSVAFFALRRKDGRDRLEEVLAQSYELFPDLAPKSNQLASSLSGGQQQMLAIARALLQEPKLLLLDEPTTGLAPRVVFDILALLKEVSCQRDVAVLLAEQSSVALEIADHVTVLRRGVVAAQGAMADLKETLDLHAAYLGS